MRIIRWALSLFLVFAMLPVGIVAAHGYECWTAGPGYRLSCGPKYHEDRDPFSGSFVESFYMTARYAQWVYGSFEWEGLRLTGGVAGPDTYAEYGNTYLYTGGGSHVYFTDWWLCKRVDSIQYDDLTISASNPTTLGTWHQDVYINSCLQTERGVHVINVHAY
jgi:hypothetical protein